MSIESLDFVFAISGGDSLETNLNTLAETLQKKGLNVQARPGNNSTTLVFAKLSGSTYSEIVEKDLVKSFELGVTAKDDAPADRPRLVYSYLTHSTESDGVGITPGKGEWKFVESITPVSGYLSDVKLFARTKDELFKPVLVTSSIFKTYGPEVALYFEFLKFFIGNLVFLSIFGVIATLRGKYYSLTFSFVNLTWGVLFLLLWNRRERYLVNFWGVQNAHKIDVHDAELTSVNKESRETPTYKDREKREGLKFVKQLSFAPIAIGFIVVLVSYQLGCFVLEIFLSEIYDGPGKMFLTLLPTVLISVFVPVLTLVYNIVVDKFLAWESHDNYISRYNSFVIKTFVLNFLTGYVPLLITAFIYLPFAHLVEPLLPNIQQTIAQNISENRYVYKYLTKVKAQHEFKINQGRLNAQFFYFVVTNQVIQLVLKYVLPLVLAHAMKFVNTKILGKEPQEVPEERDDPSEKEWLANVRNTVQLPEHDVNDDYRGLALQFGYLIMFGPVWPLAALVSLIFNVITFKLDTLKLSSGKYFRPPVPKRVDSINPWNHAFFLLTWFGSVISPIVTSFYRHGTKPPKTVGQFALDKASVNISSSVRLVLVFFISEHLFFVLYFVGTKVSTFLQSDKEIENNFVDNDIKLRRDYYSSSKKQTSVPTESSDEWQTSSIESIVKQARGLDKNTGESSGKLSGVAATKGTDQTLTSRSGLEEKRRQLQEEKEQLQKRKQLEEHKEKGDKIINTVDSDGKPTLAIIDNNQHIPMEDVEELEKKLSASEEKKDTSSISKSEDSDGVDESESAVLESEPMAESDLTPSLKKSTSKKKSLKRLLKRK